MENLEKAKTQYLESKGVRCINPECRGYNIEGKFVLTNAGGASQDMHCIDCGSGWTDLYILMDVINIDIEED